MRLLNNLKIDFQRLVFRVKRELRLRKFEKRKREAVKTANRFKVITGKKHYVLLVEDQYVIKNSEQIKEINSHLDRLAKLNVSKVDKLTVYTTK
jgi:galactokinase